MCQIQSGLIGYASGMREGGYSDMKEYSLEYEGVLGYEKKNESGTARYPEGLRPHEGGKEG